MDETKQKGINIPLQDAPNVLNAANGNSTCKIDDKMFCTKSEQNGEAQTEPESEIFQIEGTLKTYGLNESTITDKHSLSKDGLSSNGAKLEIHHEEILNSDDAVRRPAGKVFSALQNGESDCEEDPDTVCGIGGFRPKWLQPWATPRMFLVLYSILGTISGTYYSYRVGAITTLEKRFSFKSQTSGTIMMVDEITPVFLGAIVGYFGGKTHRPRMFGLGMLFSTLCCLVSALPYFIYGSSSHLNIKVSLKNGTGFEICEDEIRKESCDADDRPPTLAAVFFLMLAGFLKGFGNLAYHSIGLSYMDDTAKKKNTPLYFAVAFSLRLVGPMLGFLLSYFCLRIYENPFDDPGYGPDDPRWIGAWWIGFLVQGIVLLIFTIPVALFPRRLPGQKKLTREEKEKLSPSFKGLLYASKRLATNPLYIIIVINAIMSIFGSVGHFVMLPKYMEQQFRLSASDANLYSGPAGIVAVMISTVIGGYFMWKYKPSIKFIIAGMIVLEAIGAVGYLLLMIPRCDKVDMSNFGLNEHGLILDGDCNSLCNCSTKTISPVCGSNGKTAYFSPCHAGCKENLNQSFSDCSCIQDPAGQQSGYATKGYCVTDDCWSQALAYIITLPILQFIVNLLRVQHSIVLLRSIEPQDKSIALGTFEALICIFGFVPYLVAFGALVDSTCLVWEKSCGETGNCWFYDIDQFNNLLHAASAGFSGLSALSLLPTYFLSGRIRDLYEEEDDNNDTVDQKAVDSEKEGQKIIYRTQL